MLKARSVFRFSHVMPVALEPAFGAVRFSPR